MDVLEKEPFRGHHDGHLHGTAEMLCLELEHSFLLGGVQGGPYLLRSYGKLQSHPQWSTARCDAERGEMCM